jgi:hypothetical protein
MGINTIRRIDKIESNTGTNIDISPNGGNLVIETGNVIAENIKKNNLTSSDDPTITDDDTLGYEQGSIWINQSSGSSFSCSDNTTGAAVWVPTGGGGGAGTGGVDSYYVEEFEDIEIGDVTSGNGASVGTGGGGLNGTLSLETALPQKGSQSLKFTQDAASQNDWFYPPAPTLDRYAKAKDPTRRRTWTPGPRTSSTPGRRSRRPSSATRHFSEAVNPRIRRRSSSGQTSRFGSACSRCRRRTRSCSRSGSRRRSCARSTTTPSSCKFNDRGNGAVFSAQTGRTSSQGRRQRRRKLPRTPRDVNNARRRLHPPQRHYHRRGSTGSSSAAQTTPGNAASPPSATQPPPEAMQVEQTASQEEGAGWESRQTRKQVDYRPGAAKRVLCPASSLRQALCSLRATPACHSRGDRMHMHRRPSPSTHRSAWVIQPLPAQAASARRRGNL